MPDFKEIKVFIIEDDFVFIEILANLLDTINDELKEKKLKINYHTFYSAKEAGYELRMLPDIVLLDYFIMDDELNTATGTELLHAIKERDPKVDVIVVSGQESQEIKEELLKEGATSYISKDEDSLSTLKPLLMASTRQRCIGATC